MITQLPVVNPLQRGLFFNDTIYYIIKYINEETIDVFFGIKNIHWRMKEPKHVFFSGVKLACPGFPNISVLPGPGLFPLSPGIWIRCL